MTSYTSEPTIAHPRQLHSPSEAGQAIILITFVIIGLIGMLGLAIDGGGLFFLQRDAQNATDATVLAAAYAICTKGDPVTVGLTTMAQNGFNNNGVTNTVQINYPPKSGQKAGNMNYVEVILNAHKPAYFIQLLYRQPLQVTTHAIGNCYPPFDPTSVPGLWAGSATCENTVDWSGSNSTIIGGMFSNNEIKFTGSDINLSGGEIEAVTDIETSNGGKVDYDPSYPPTTGVVQKPDPLGLDIGLYAPGGEVAITVPTGFYHAIPRLETTGWKSNSQEWNPDNGTVIQGLYFIEGNVSIGNGVLVGPKGVTIVATGTIDFSGEALGEATGDPLIRYYEGIMAPTARGDRYPGLIFFSNLDQSSQCPNGAGQGGLKITGPSNFYKGIVYAPRATVAMSGASITFTGTILANSINYSGSEGRLQYDPSLLPPRPPQIEMVE